MISVYSVFSAVAFYNIALIAVYILMRKTEFVIKHTASSLLLLTFLAMVRLFIPADISYSVVIKSSKVFPMVQTLVSTPVYTPGFTVGTVICIIWAIGILYSLGCDFLRMAADRARERRMVCTTNEAILSCAEEMGIKHPIKISSDIPMPYSAGILRPCIYMPEWDMNEQEIKFVLSHEMQHIRSMDALKKLIFLFMEAIFWWNPVAHIFRREFDQLLEIHCDSRMLAGKSDKEKLDYAYTLIDAVKRMDDIPQGVTCGSAFTDNFANIKQRFELIIKDKGSKYRVRKLAFNLLLVLAFFLSFFVIVQPHYETPFVSEDGSRYAEVDSMFILHIENGYYLSSDGNVTPLSEDDFDNPFIASLPIYDSERVFP